MKFEANIDSLLSYYGVTSNNYPDFELDLRHVIDQAYALGYREGQERVRRLAALEASNEDRCICNTDEGLHYAECPVRTGIKIAYDIASIPIE